MWSECGYNEATLLLYDIMMNCKLEGVVHFNFGDSSVAVNCIYYKQTNATAMYIHNQHDLKSLKKDTLLRISRIQFGPSLFPYGLVSQDDIIRYAFYISRKSEKRRPYSKTPTLDSWFKKHSKPLVTKVSASHLRHVTMNDMIRIGRDELFQQVGYLFPFLERLAKAGMHESMFVGILTWARMLTPQNARIAQISGIWDWQFDNLAAFVKKIKNNFSLRLKALQNLVPMDLEQFFELEVLVNRGIGEVDWQAEQDHRTRPNTNIISDDHIFTEAVKLFKKLRQRGARPTRTNWDRFWASRWGWAPTGAYHSQYADDAQYRAKEATLRNKLFAVSTMPERNLDFFLNRSPSIVAWPSVKYEWGKQRAIYGVDFTNFVMTNFALYRCEEVLEPIFPVGRAASEEVVSNRVGETLRNGVPYCFDFEDFNSQHTNRNMQDVLRAYALVFSSRLSEEQVSALNWVIESITNGYVKEGNNSYKLNGTLLSGWRLTTFVNTVLNHIYITVLTKQDPIVTLHNGDDVLAGVSRLAQVQNLQKNAARCNVRFQRSKCFLGSIAEFLRVDHNKRTGAQYLCRGVATFVHGPTEAVIPNDIVSVLQSLKTRRGELLARNANKAIVEQIYNLQLDRVSRLWDMDKKDVIIVLQTHLSKGGVSEEITTDSLSHQIIRKQIRSSSGPQFAEDSGRALPGVWDYATHMCKKIIDKSFHKQLVNTLTKATLAATIKNKFGVTISKKMAPDMFDVLEANMNGLLRRTMHGTKAVIAKAYGIPLFGIIGELDEIFDRISQERDPIKAMKIML
uniref:RNA-directed RNA polymerase n=1 Tax=Uromyces fabae virus TaxID=3069272 RepID=A0AA51UAG7_9VIRU|nr:putative RNA-dependent RNA polymerase [Uromyces fabae virus]